MAAMSSSHYEKLPRRRFQSQPRQFLVCFVNRRRGILGGMALVFCAEV